MDDAEGFVVHGNKKAWIKYALRAVPLGIIVADILSITNPYLRAHLHQPVPVNIVLAELISFALFLWTTLSLVLALLVKLMANCNPLVSINQEGVRINSMGRHSRRLRWDEIKSIYIWKPAYDFRIFKIPWPERIVVIPHDPESLYKHLTDGEKRWLFGSANPTKYHRRYWTEIAALVMDTSPDEFMQRLNRYYQRYAWRPGLPGGPFPVNLTLSTPAPESSGSDINRPRLDASRSRIMIRATMQRRVLRRPAKPSQTGMRRVTGHQAVPSAPAVINEAPRSAQPMTSAPSETDTQVTPDELIAALEAIDYRKAEAQRRRAEASAIGQVQKAACMDASSETLLNRQGSSPEGSS